MFSSMNHRGREFECRGRRTKEVVLSYRIRRCIAAFCRQLLKLTRVPPLATLACPSSRDTGAPHAVTARFLRSYIVTACASIAGGLSWAVSVTPAAEAIEIAGRPNIVFIIADDLRYDLLACNGHPHAKTPHIDRLAREGASFTSFFATTPLCSPSRASFSDRTLSTHTSHHQQRRSGPGRSQSSLDDVPTVTP